MRWPCKRKWEIEELEWGENVKCGLPLLLTAL